jgi:ACS family tartrate transporter-like MFS transporter
VTGPLLLRNRPSEANWLRPEECASLEQKLHDEQTEAQGAHLPFAKAIVSPAIVLLMLINLFVGWGVYGKAYFLPLMIKSLGFGNTAVGYLTMIPAIAGVIGMLISPAAPTIPGSACGTSSSPVY